MVKIKCLIYGQGLQTPKMAFFNYKMFGDKSTVVGFTLLFLILVMCRVPLRFSKQQKKADWTEMKKKLTSYI